MTFADIINKYTSILNCTAKELSRACGISEATFSRLRSGEKLPDIQIFKSTENGILSIAKLKNITDVTADDIKSDFALCADLPKFDAKAFKNNLNHLISSLSLNAADISRSLNYDSSYISRIRNGQRIPSDPEKMARGVAEFVTARFYNEAEQSAVVKLTGYEKDCFETEEDCKNAVYAFLFDKTTDTDTKEVSAFLKALNDFDLNKYISAIHFDELKVPSVPFSLPTSKYYYGVEAMKKGEIDFFKATVLSRSTKPVFLYSDMPMDDMAADIEFSKKYMFGLALLLKKKLHLNIIHDLNRPFNELMLGLESHIPLYMTGQISPYYLKGVQNNVFCHFLKVSGAAALSGECIDSHHNDGMYYLTNSKTGLEYYQKRADDLLEKAYPLMEIYRDDRKNHWNSFISADAGTDGDRRNILSSLPIYTATPEFLNTFLSSKGLNPDEIKSVCEFAQGRRAEIEKILLNNRITDEIPEFTKEEFENHPISLSVAGMFLESDFTYTYDDYISHLRLTEKFAETHPNYELTVSSVPAFRNINIYTHTGEWAMVSKNTAPVIHFVIKHPKLRQAIENIMIPVVEE